MSLKLPALIVALGCISASAYAAMPVPGSAATISGRAHVEHQGGSTYLYLNGSAAGVVPFGDKSTFPDIDRLEGREVQITGVVDGQQHITLTNQDQIRIAD